MVHDAFNLTTKEADVNLCEVSLVYKVTSRPSRAKKKKPYLKNQNQTNKHDLRGWEGDDSAIKNTNYSCREDPGDMVLSWGTSTSAEPYK